MKLYLWQEQMIRRACQDTGMIGDEIDRVIEFVRTMPESVHRMIMIDTSDVYGQSEA